MENSYKYFRHGDLWIRPLEKGEEQKGEKLQADKVRLALGEATGHVHLLQGIHPGALITFWGKDGDVNGFTLEDDATITHQEHHMRKMPAGDYVIDKEVEWDYFKEEQRVVAD